MRGTTVPNNAVVIMDMYGNSSWRWEDEDGTLTASVKIGSSYHLPGPVTCCTDTTFRKLIEITMPIVRDAACLGKVFIPPLSSMSLERVAAIQVTAQTSRRRTTVQLFCQRLNTSEHC